MGCVRFAKSPTRARTLEKVFAGSLCVGLVVICFIRTVSPHGSLAVDVVVLFAVRHAMLYLLMEYGWSN